MSEFRNRSPLERLDKPHGQQRQWVYPDDISAGGECSDCGADYGDEGWADLIVPDDVWEAINPTPYPGAGVLCCNCILRRLKFLGMEEVPMYWGSGPFSRTGETPSWKKRNDAQP